MLQKIKNMKFICMEFKILGRQLIEYHFLKVEIVRGR
jgi:hypothetical protein